MTTVIIAVLLASLVGSPHCACMCGPLIAFTMGMEGKTESKKTKQVVFYHFGRLLAYLSLGALAFVMATALDQSGFLIGVQHFSAFLSAFLLIPFGLISISRVYGIPLSILRAPQTLTKFVFFAHRKARAFRPSKRAFFTGILTSVLPCGWLYVFVVMAAGSGSLVWGLLIMGSFWVGTLPVLTVCTLGIQEFTSRLSPKIRLIPALVIVLLGIFTVSSRMKINDQNQSSLFEKIQSSQEYFSTIPNVLSSLKPLCKNHDK